MATLYTPPESPTPGRPSVAETFDSSGPDRVEFMPVLLAQLQDDLARSRKREAFWISVVVHILAILAIAFSPKFMPKPEPVAVATAEDIIRNRELTYLEAPPDRQAPPVKPPDTNFMSDKNRIATSRNPSIDKEALDKLRDSRRPGAPRPPAQQQAERAAAPSAPAAENHGAQAQQGAPAQASNTPSPVLNLPPARPSGGQQPNPFGGAMSAGTAIAEAARNSSRASAGGSSGDYGLGPTVNSGKIRSDLDVLSDTMGVDFGPYLSRVLQSVRLNWYNLIPEVARPPLLKRGKVAIEFVILKDGRVAGMQIRGPSGDVSLDRAAWGGITASNPFPPLPTEFRGPYLALRFHFYYNPDRNELQ